MNQASLSWNIRFTKYLLNQKVTGDDVSVFHNKAKSVIIVFFVDIGLVIDQNKNEVDIVLMTFAKEFEITSEYPKERKLYYLGMDINATT